MTHDSAKKVQKAVIVSGNLGKKGKEKRHFRTTKPRKMALKWLMTASKGDEGTKYSPSPHDDDERSARLETALSYLPKRRYEKSVNEFRSRIWS